MITNTIKKSSLNKNTSVKPSTVPLFQGWFKKMIKVADESLSCRFTTGIAMDGLDRIVFIREGGQFNLSNFFSGFS
jgi:hypothetical protein